MTNKFGVCMSECFLFNLPIFEKNIKTFEPCQNFDQKIMEKKKNGKKIRKEKRGWKIKKECRIEERKGGKKKG